jgi:hypothetical protein
MSPAPASAIAAQIAARRSPTSRARGRRRDLQPDRGRLLAARVVVGDDDQIRVVRGDLAHLRALADVAVAAGAEHRDQPARDVRPQRGDGGGERVGRVRVVDVDRRALGGDRRALEPAADGLQPAKRVEHLGRLASGGEREPGGNERVGGLVGADQREQHLVPAAFVLDLKILPQVPGSAVDEANALARLADAEDGERAGPRRCNDPLAPGVVGPHHGRAALVHDLGEQPHLGGEVVLHVGMIIEVVARQVGEGAGHDRQPFVAVLRQAVARGFVGDVSDAFAREPGHVREEGHDVRRGQPGRDAFVGGGHPERADRGRAMAAHAPDLPGHLDGRGLAVGARDRDDRLGNRAEELRRELREGPARLRVGEVRGARDFGLRARDDGDAPAVIAAGMNSSPLTTAPWNAPKTVPGATLR